jgi:hypothetical protein
LHRQALKEYEKILGMEYSDILISVNNLALILQYQGKYEIVQNKPKKIQQSTEILNIKKFNNSSAREIGNGLFITLKNDSNETGIPIIMKTIISFF